MDSIDTSLARSQVQRLLDRQLDEIPPGQGELGRMLEALGKALQTRTMEELGNVVELSVESSHVAIFAARMLSELQAVDSRAHGVAAAAEQLVSTVKQIDSYGSDTAAQAREVDRAIESGTGAVATASSRMSEIDVAVGEGARQVEELVAFTSRIGAISDEIRNIAEQTNLLALNASIEAARAGSAGRGFAVVAAEVKTLSARTANATGDITSTIAELQTEMEQALGSMTRSGEAVAGGQDAMRSVQESMAEIAEKMKVVTENTSQISLTLREQNSAADEVANGIAAIADSSAKSVQAVDHIVDALSDIEQRAVAEISALATFELPHKVLRLARFDHVLWVKRLATMLAGKTGLNAEELSDCHGCRLGKWYDQCRDERYIRQPAFAAIFEPHRQVH